MKIQKILDRYSARLTISPPPAGVLEFIRPGVVLVFPQLSNPVHILQEMLSVAPLPRSTLVFDGNCASAGPRSIGYGLGKADLTEQTTHSEH